MTFTRLQRVLFARHQIYCLFALPLRFLQLLPDLLFFVANIA